MGVLNTEATRDPQKDDNKVKDHLQKKIDFRISFSDYRDRANHSYDTHV